MSYAIDAGRLAGARSARQHHAMYAMHATNGRQAVSARFYAAAMVRLFVFDVVVDQFEASTARVGRGTVVAATADAGAVTAECNVIGAVRPLRQHEELVEWYGASWRVDRFAGRLGDANTTAATAVAVVARAVDVSVVIGIWLVGQRHRCADHHAHDFSLLAARRVCYTVTYWLKWRTW